MIEIHCNVPYGIAETDFELMKLKSGVLVKDIKKMNKDEPKRHYMIVSMNILNILETHDNFEHTHFGKLEMECITLVGRIADLDCYVDLHMKDNMILLHWDKQTMRDMKISKILGESSNKEYSGTIEAKVFI